MPYIQIQLKLCSQRTLLRSTTKRCLEKGSFRMEEKNSQSTAVTKKDFAPNVDNEINKTINPDILKNGFQASGLYPWKPDNIYLNKCLGKTQVVTDLTTV